MVAPGVPQVMATVAPLRWSPPPTGLNVGVDVTCVTSYTASAVGLDAR